MLPIVGPVELADISQCVALRIDILGSLVIGRPPPYPGYAENQEASVRRDLATKPYVHHLKVVQRDDSDTDDVTIAYAKWEIYQNGRPDIEKLQLPMDEADKRVDEYGALREAAHNYFCQRNGKMGQRPHILLALLVTSSRHRRQGAGSLLVQCGVDLSEKLGLPCYLQASDQGRRLYRHHGFEVLDTVEFDLTQFGLQGAEVMTEMIRYPSTTAGKV